MDDPKRKPMRLPEYDYGSNGCYFVTICTQDRRCVLSRVVGQGLAPAENRLSRYGKLVENELLDLEKRYDFVKIDKYVIMPNHIHAIVRIEKAAGASPCPTLSDIMCAFKSLATRKCRQAGMMGKLFQTSFHDHVIRNRDDYLALWEYTDGNPLKWAEDEYNCERVTE